MLIANMDPLVILYFDGFLRVSLMEYDLDSTDEMIHLTNTALAKERLDDDENLSIFEKREHMNE
jgi:hypothetical protein